jgi:PIN domain nuclease of toxin-antitoxin system
VNIVDVADTHAALWHLYDDPRLLVTADIFLMDATSARHKIAISSISLVEVAYLVEKARIWPTAFDDLVNVLADPDHIFVEVPVTKLNSDALRRVPRAAVPDMPDRIIAATGLHLDVPVLSRDSRIRAANLKTIW